MSVVVLSACYKDIKIHLNANRQKTDFQQFSLYSDLGVFSAPSVPPRRPEMKPSDQHLDAKKSVTRKLHGVETKYLLHYEKLLWHLSGSGMINVCI